MPPHAGKRPPRGLRRGGGNTAPSFRIKYRPRPYIQAEFQGQPVTILIDTGAERSFINEELANLAANTGYTPERNRTDEIRLADGQTTSVPEQITLDLLINQKTYRHTFGVLPALDSPILMGTDLWAKTGIPLRPPRRGAYRPRQKACNLASGLRSQTPEEERELQTFLAQELAKFDEVRGPTDHDYHYIRVKRGPPIKQRYRPRNPAMQNIIDTEVTRMENEGIIEPSRSAWSSPVVLVKKKDGAYRFCIDFRKVNEVTERDAYPLPQITATLDKLRGARYLSTIDLKNGYWQIPLHPDSRPVTAFTVPGRGLMQFKVMPFGLHSAPATFQRILDGILGPELEPRVFVYLDDIIVISETFAEHLQILREVFQRLRHAKLRLNPEKCHFCRTKLRYLGHIVDQRGIHTDPEKIEAITKWPAPHSVRGIRQFLGMVSWYRRFVPNFSSEAQALIRLTRKNARWKWGEEEEKAFDGLKRRLISAPVLACPDFNRRFILQTDASTHGLGAVLTQNFNEGERVIAYASRTLSPAERNYSATELECLAIVWGIRRMREYLEGYPFTVVTDHQALRWLQKLEAPSGRLGRWLFELQQHEFDIRYRKGSLNRVADALSRQPVTCAAAKARGNAWYQRIVRQTREGTNPRPEYELRGRKLYRLLIHDTDFREVPRSEQWKECVPEEQRQQLLQRLHDEPTAGHLGIAKTIHRVARHYYWPGMFRDIARYVRNCRSCQAHKASQLAPAGKLHTTPVKAPWTQVAIDLVGPLPRSTNGHTWLLNLQDRFTKWVEMRPLRQATAEAVNRHFIEAVLYRHGCPARIITDNGTQFTSQTLQRTLQEFGITHQKTPAYTPQCNPVERTNRTLKTMITQYVDSNHRHWDRNIAAIQYAYNTAKHDATGYTPAYLNHGRELSPPLIPRRDDETDPHGAGKRLADAYQLVRLNLARAFQRQEHYYNLRRRDWQPRLGDPVWKREHTLSNKEQGYNAKLGPKYRGPLIIRKILSPVIFDLRDETTGKWYRHTHITDLKPAPIADESDSSDEE